jgi:hypothetical protein
MHNKYSGESCKKQVELLRHDEGEVASAFAVRSLV